MFYRTFKEDDVPFPLYRSLKNYLHQMLHAVEHMIRSQHQESLHKRMMTRAGVFLPTILDKMNDCIVMY